VSDVASGCNCFTKVNALLREHNTAIDLTDTINMKSGNFERRMTVPTARIDTKKRKGPMRVFATFCPMCGVKYSQASDSSEHKEGK
jgi:hypothetical protein